MSPRYQDYQDPMNSRRFIDRPIEAEETSKRISVLNATPWMLPSNTLGVSNDYAS